MKNKVAKILDDKYGLDISTALNMLLKRISDSKTLSINGLTENGYTPEFEKRVLEDAKNSKGGKTYKSVKDMWTDVPNW